MRTLNNTIMYYFVNFSISEIDTTIILKKWKTTLRGMKLIWYMSLYQYMMNNISTQLNLTWIRSYMFLFISKSCIVLKITIKMIRKIENSEHLGHF